jgi:hypothetical protein
LRFKFHYLWLLAALSLCTGCQSPRIAQPLTTTVGGNDLDQQLTFWHDLSRRPLTSNDEAFHGLLLFMDQQDTAGTYANRVKLLKSRNLLAQSFHRPADEAVDRGTLAVPIARFLKLGGGWALHLFSHSERYAVKELEYANLYPPSTPNQTFSGEDFVAIIGRLEDYQRGDPANVPATVLPGEMAGAKTSEAR